MREQTNSNRFNYLFTCLFADWYKHVSFSAGHASTRLEHNRKSDSEARLEEISSRTSMVSFRTLRFSILMLTEEY